MVFPKVSSHLIFLLIFGNTICVDRYTVRISNGREIEIFEAPYQAILTSHLLTGKFLTCGASIISRKTFLTAAHCVPQRKKYHKIQITIGSDSRGVGHKFSVSTLFAHSRYRNFHDYDIAMGYFDQPLVFNAKVQPIQWLTNRNLPKGGDIAYVTGFGVTEDHPKVVSKKLRRVKVRILSSSECAEIMENFHGKRQICGKQPYRYGGNSCKGDSGGPVVVNGLLAGLVSWGFICGGRGPAAYTRVSAFNDWIVQNIRK